VYLDIKPETSMERIAMRNREVESGIGLDYLQMLYQEYEDFIEDISRTIPVIRVPWEQFRDANEMAEMIEREYLETSFLRQVQWKPTRI
ncbi:MAG: deoxynucleoside kinase, partial [Myxococcota bacterium]|nr:deoxynucleoside kinase [Myxococcota bacterium]